MPGETHVGCWEKFLLRKSVQALEQAPREVVESLTLEVFKKMDI